MPVRYEVSAVDAVDPDFNNLKSALNDAAKAGGKVVSVTWADIGVPAGPSFVYVIEYES
jgi:hypothetical protein